MGIFIGGDTQELEYDFGLKVSGSINECPMKIYRQEVDPANLPDPTTGWTEITSQTVLDKLKSQNELTVSAIASDKSTVTWNGKTLNKTSTLKILDDFQSKISGSVVENPHLAKYKADSINLQIPSAFASEFPTTDSWRSYDNIKLLSDSKVSGLTASVVNNTPQMLFSFNLIEMFERKFGAIPKETTAEKVAWLKSNIVYNSGITCKWYGYGINPLGNKAYFGVLNSSGTTYVGNLSNTSKSPSLLNLILDSTNYIHSDGFVHFLAYTDSARTTDSTLLVLTGHGLSQWDLIENVTRSKVAQVSAINSSNCVSTYSVASQIGGDTINKYHINSSKIASTGTTTTNLNVVAHGLSTGDYVANNTRGGVISKITVVDSDNLTVSYAIAGQTSGDSITLFKFTGTQTAESTVIPSTIYTDYVSLELTLKAPENLITATNTLSDIVTDFTGKVAGSVTECANIGKWEVTTSLNAPSNVAFSEFSQANGYDKVKTLDGIIGTSTTSLNSNIPQQLFSFSIIMAVEKALGQPIPAVDKVQWCKDNLYSITGSWYGYGSCPSGNKASLAIYKDSTSSWVVANTTTSSSVANLNITNNVEIPTRIDSNGVIHFLAYTDASDGVTPSTIFTDYVKLTIKLKYIPTYDFYTDANTRRDAGLTDIVLVKRTIGDMISDFTGKVSGSVVENPNIAKYIKTSSLQVPNAFSTEDTDAYYNLFKTLDGNCFSVTTTTNGQISQALFQFNLIEIAQRALGTSIPGADTASKVQWLKDNLSNVVCDWWGYGSCPGGNKATLTRWQVDISSWNAGTTTISGSVTQKSLNLTTNISPYIDSNGMCYYLAYSDASDGVTPSVINTDYVKLTLTFKVDSVGYEYFTNNSAEVSVTTNNKASAYLIECDLTPIATALYGGSNAALKNALKRIQADVYAMGSGANVNQLGYGCVYNFWSGYNYFCTSPTNNISSIIDLQRVINVPDSLKSIMQTTNKIYILVNSTYKSDGAIASEVNLDYVNIKIGLARTPDIISNPPTIELTDTWSILVRGFSPAWDDSCIAYKRIFELYKDVNNSIRLYYNYGVKKWYVVHVENSMSVTIMSNTLSLIKFNTTNFLLTKVDNKIKMYFMHNNDVVNITSELNSQLTGDCTLTPLHGFTNNYQADAFLDSIVYLPNQTFDDATAEAILRGTKEGFEMPELFDINAVILHANATRSNGVITLVATAGYQSSYIYIPVLPNNQYTLTFNKTGSGAYIHLDEYYNNVLLKIDSGSTFNTKDIDGSKTCTIITGNKTNYIKVVISNSTSGTFTFSNISLKLCM